MPSIFPGQQSYNNDFGPTPKKDDIGRYDRRTRRLAIKNTENSGSKCILHPDIKKRKLEQYIQPTDEQLPTDMERLTVEMNNLRGERDAALAENKRLHSILDASSLSYDSVKDNDTKCKEMTGLTYQTFGVLDNYVNKHVKKGHQTNAMEPKQRLFMTLVKLRHNVTFQLLAHVAGISKSGCVGIFWSTIELLYARLSFLVKFQDRHQIYNTIPTHMKRLYPRLTSIIDCFEIFIDAPKILKAKQQCFSHYKKHNTIKVFISCTPNGSVNYISKCYGGRTSDVQLVRDCGYIKSECHQRGDQILGNMIVYLINTCYM